MSLVYRAMWQERRTDAVDKTADAFRDWAVSKYPDLVDVSDGCVSDAVSDGATVTASMISVHDGGLRGLEAQLIEDGSQERWTTQLRTLTEEGAETWVWVDLERVADDIFKPQDVAAPRLVRTLLEEAAVGNAMPHCGPAFLKPSAIAVHPDRVEADLISLIRNDDRSTPVVVFSHDVEVEPAETMDRATVAAEILAGVATVWALSPDAQEVFQDEVGRDLSVWGGAARLYLPGELAPTRHRYLRREIVQRHRREAGRRFAQMLQRSIAARRAPAIYQQIRPMFRGDGGKSTDELLSIAEAEIAEKSAQIDELRAELENAQDEKLNAYVEVETLQEQLNSQRRQMRDLKARAVGREISAEEWAVPEEVTSSVDVARYCHEFLDGVVLPAEACRDLEKLDETIEGEAWAQTAWNGFRALHAYAQEAKSFNGGFWEWCQRGESPDTWPATDKKLAMSESETVMSNDRLRSCRDLPVDRSVNESGTITMGAHLKVAEGGGGNAPRIYFHDDCKGATGKIHVGFFGPHKYMPNTRTN